jgi:hypothetical protein
VLHVIVGRPISTVEVMSDAAIIKQLLPIFCWTDAKNGGDLWMKYDLVSLCRLMLLQCSPKHVIANTFACSRLVLTWPTTLGG